jgi:hypothetical protein
VKECKKCNKVKIDSQFELGRYECKKCKKERQANWYLNNKDKVKALSKEYNLKNKERLKPIKQQSDKKYRLKNRDKINKKTTTNYYLNQNEFKKKQRKRYVNRIMPTESKQLIEVKVLYLLIKSEIRSIKERV